MPAFFYGGRFWNVPPGIRNLQFNQLRSHLYPRDPYLAGEAIEAYGQPTPEYLPQRMMFTRWKTPPMRAAWLQNVVGFLRALAQGPQTVQQLEQASGLPPMLPFWEAGQAFGADQLPQPDLEPGPEPISRGVLPPERMHLTPDELESLGREQMTAVAAGYGAAHSAKEQALAEVHAAVEQTNSTIYGGMAEADPWFLR